MEEQMNSARGRRRLYHESFRIAELHSCGSKGPHPQESSCPNTNAVQFPQICSLSSKTPWIPLPSTTKGGPQSYSIGRCRSAESNKFAVWFLWTVWFKLAFLLRALCTTMPLMPTPAVQDLPASRAKRRGISTNENSPLTYAGVSPVMSVNVSLFAHFYWPKWNHGEEKGFTHPSPPPHPAAGSQKRCHKRKYINPKWLKCLPGVFQPVSSHTGVFCLILNMPVQMISLLILHR